MSESESEGGAQRPALPVPPPPTSLPKQKGPPTTAAEYLRLVREQSAALPNIFVSSTPAPSCKKRRSSFTPSPIPSPPDFAIPDPQWQRDLVFWFAELQKNLARLPPVDYEAPKVKHVHECDILLSTIPKLSKLRAMDYVSIFRILRFIDEGTSIKHFTPDDHHDVDITGVQPSFIEGFRADWLFSCLCFVQPPISGEAGSVIRSLLRKVAINRVSLPEEYNDDAVPTLNVLITILGKYFRQEDVASQ